MINRYRTICMAYKEKAWLTINIKQTFKEMIF